MQLEAHHIHVWSADLTTATESFDYMLSILSEDERGRAQRFRFEIHRKRFIIARYTLREILSLYLQMPPQNIQFTYSEHRKPALLNHPDLQFNLAHSHDIAVYALTLQHPVGIDIEKIEGDKQDLAKRFFSTQEITVLQAKPEPERISSFYRVWARKEALLKAVGTGLSIPLASFSVATDDILESVQLEGSDWTLLSIPIDPGYQAALASTQTIHSISYWKFFNQQPKLISISSI